MALWGKVTIFMSGSISTDQHESRSQPTGDMTVSHINLYILSTRQQITVPLNERVILGRSPETEVEGTHYVDLTPFYGYQLGVSRRHLMLVCDQQKHLVAFDLDSQNGSLLNGETMSSKTGYPLKNGDELQLGSLSLRVYYTDKIPFSQENKQRPSFTVDKTKAQHPETHAPLPFPEPSIRDTLETRPLRSLPDIDKD